MSIAKSVFRAVLPSPIRQLLRTRYRNWVFDRAMKQLVANPEAVVAPDNRVISRLIYGWGNEAWACSDEYLRSCVKHAATANGPILECGSGLTSVVMGAIAQQRNNTVWSLEHTPLWGERVQRALDTYGIRAVHLSVRPLKDYDGYSWYDPPLGAMPGTFALVICDGPPGDTRGGRYGLAPVMRERLAPNCVILLDDASRKQEQAIGKRWEAELGALCETLGTEKPFLRMTLGGGSGQAHAA